MPEPYELRTDNQPNSVLANLTLKDLHITKEYYHTAPTLNVLQGLYKTSLVGLAI